MTLGNLFLCPVILPAINFFYYLVKASSSLAPGPCTYSCHHLRLWIISTLHLQCYLEGIYSLWSCPSWAFICHISSFPQTLLLVCGDLFSFFMYFSRFLSSFQREPNNAGYSRCCGTREGRRVAIIPPHCMCSLQSRASELIMVLHIKISIIPVN